MNVKPGDLFFGLVDFLAYIVPGSVFCLTFPAYFEFRKQAPIDVTCVSPTVFSWFVFILASYVAGHFIHHICAMVLNPLYSWTYERQKRKKYHDFIDVAERTIWEKIPLHANLLKIAEADLRLRHPALLPELERYLANAKFFRSLCVLCLYLCFYPGLEGSMIITLIILSAFAFAKYASQRWTYRFRTYEYFVLSYERRDTE